MSESIINIDNYSEVRECDYKGEHYSVRDNGAIMRHSREGKSMRKGDNIWSFGSKDDKSGYMIFCGARVHIVVATAFLGANDSTKLVVDHIDQIDRGYEDIEHRLNAIGAKIRREE